MAIEEDRYQGIQQFDKNLHTDNKTMDTLLDVTEEKMKQETYHSFQHLYVQDEKAMNKLRMNINSQQE